jgi:hypothetical protein
MKTILAAILLLSVLAVLPLTAAGPNDKRLSMEQRLTETDISVALKHYEAVRMQLLDARLRQELADTDIAGKPADREAQLKALTQRIEILERYVKGLREDLLKAGQIAAATSSRN